MARPVVFPSGPTVDIEDMVPLKLGVIRELANQDPRLVEVLNGESTDITLKCQCVMSIFNSNGENITLDNFDEVTEKWLDKLIEVLGTDDTPEPEF